VLQGAFSACRTFAQVKERRKEPSVDGARTPGEQGLHRVVAQDAHVVDRVSACRHARNQAGSLQAGVRRAGRADVHRGQLMQAGPLREGHQRDQSRVRHEIRVIERCAGEAQSIGSLILPGKQRFSLECAIEKIPRPCSKPRQSQPPCLRWSAALRSARPCAARRASPRPPAASIQPRSSRPALSVAGPHHPGQRKQRTGRKRAWQNEQTTKLLRKRDD